MTTDDKIRDEELQYNINKEPAKILALSSGKIVQYEYLTGEEILPFDQRRVIEQAKTIEDKKKKQIKAIENHGKQLVESNVLVKNMIIILKTILFEGKRNT